MEIGRRDWNTRQICGLAMAGLRPLDTIPAGGLIMKQRRMDVYVLRQHLPHGLLTTYSIITTEETFVVGIFSAFFMSLLGSPTAT